MTDSSPILWRHDMAKRKAASKPRAPFLFKKEWIFDPGPEFFRLDRSAISRVNQLKTQFTTNINTIIKRAQG